MKHNATWDTENIFHRANEFYNAVLEDISHARESIDLEVYIFNHDALGQRFMEALKEAAKRKVIVRVIADGFGAAEWASRYIPGLLNAGVDVRVFRPMPWFFLRTATSRVPPLNRIVRLLVSMNRRNHRKLWIIDGCIAYVGSLNISADHLEKAEGGGSWRDTGIRVEGSAVAELIWGFEKAWSASWRFGGRRSFFNRRLSAFRPDNQSGLVRLNDRLKSRRWLFRNLLHRISFSKTRIWITNPYFIPSRRLVLRLCLAARRGVDVRILVPRRPDHKLVHWVTSAFFKRLLRARVRIFEYLPSVLHAKLVQIDDWAIVGSSNLNHRSLLHDLEVDLVVTHEESKASLERQFLLDLTQSEEITSRVIGKRSWLGMLLGRILLLFRHWM